MDNRYLFLLSVVLFLCLTQTEGFITVYNNNLTTDSSNPDKKQCCPAPLLLRSAWRASFALAALFFHESGVHGFVSIPFIHWESTGFA